MYYENKLFYAESSIEECDICVVGLPYDSTVSFRPGSRFGPVAFRQAACGVESYSPYFDSDVSDVNICDLGDIEIPFGSPERACKLIEQEALEKWISKDHKLISIGGEHLVSYPLIKAYEKIYGQQLHVIQLDAHADLREGYLGCKLSHASVMRLIKNFLPEENIHQFFIRSGTKEEWNELRSNPNNYLPLHKQIDIHAIELDAISDKPVYLTIDIDVFDPSVCPGTGTPEPGGIDFNTFMEILKRLSLLNMVGADIVELAPHYDQSGCSSVLAAKVFRELVLSLSN